MQWSAPPCCDTDSNAQSSAPHACLIPRIEAMAIQILDFNNEALDTMDHSRMESVCVHLGSLEAVAILDICRSLRHSHQRDGPIMQDRYYDQICYPHDPVRPAGVDPNEQL